MSEVLTTDTYKTIYKDIIPSDDFRQRMLNQGIETKIYKMKPRLSYVAAIVACMVLMVGGTVYAYTHPALIQMFFGGDVSQNIVETVYSEIEQKIYCDGYIYTLEGNYFDDVEGRGYYTIKVEAEDGSVPTVKWYGFDEEYEIEREVKGEYWDPAYLVYHFYKVGNSDICILYQAQISGWLQIPDTVEEEEYLYLAYETVDISDTVGISIIPLEEFKEKYREICQKGNEKYAQLIESKLEETNGDSAFHEAMRESELYMMDEFRNAFESIELPHQLIECVEYDYDGIHVEISYSCIKATWNRNETDVQSVATIVDGERKVWVNRGDAITGSHIAYRGSNQGYEEGDMEFQCWSLGLRDPKTVQIEINGVILGES